MCINMDVLLIRMLTSTLWWHINHRALQQLEQSLLNALTTDISGDAGVITLTCNLINLVNKDDTTLCSLHIIVGYLEQARQDAFHILAYIACLRKHGSIDNGEWHIQHLGNGTSQQGLTCSRRTHHDDVRLLNLNTIIISRLLQTLVMIIHSHRQEAFSLILSYHVLIKMFFNFLGLRHTLQLERQMFLLGIRAIAIGRSHLIGLNGTILTDTSVHARYQELHLSFRTAAEITLFLHHFFTNT